MDGKVENFEVPERAENILGALITYASSPTMQPEEHGLDPILAIHDPQYIDFLENIYQKTADYHHEAAPVFPGTFSSRRPQRISTHPEAQPGYYCFGIWTPILASTWQVAYASAQCAITAADYLLSGHPAAYAVCRPPGHHAGSDFYGGYCYLNNAAIAARYLQQNAVLPSTPKIAIVDIDYHHGNGTQQIFYADASVIYCSIHADPDQEYPYFWGAADELGIDAGWGYNRNYPLPRGTTTREYLATLGNLLTRLGDDQPAYLLVSIGYDIGIDDPEGGFRLTRTGFRQIGSMLASMNLPTLFIQEGGYRLDHLGDWCAALMSGFYRV